VLLSSIDAPSHDEILETIQELRSTCRGHLVPTLVHHDSPRHGGGSDPENGDATTPFCGDIGGVVIPDDEGEGEIRFVWQVLNHSGQSGIVFLEAVGDQTELNIMLMEPDDMS
jgi:hypothetical protein